MKMSSGCGACSIAHSGFTISHVGRVDDRPPGERDDPAGERRADQHRARAGSPQPAIEPAQRRREQETRRRRDRDHLDVARLLAVDRGTDELREAVRGPAERVQPPEQEVAVAAQEVEIHPANLFKYRRAVQRPVPPAARLVAGGPSFTRRHSYRRAAASSSSRPAPRNDGGARTSTPEPCRRRSITSSCSRL